MRILSFNVYKFNELSEEAQKKAHENYLNKDYFSYHWVDEGIKSIQAFAGAFGIGLKDWSISTYGHSFIHTNADRDAFRGIDFDKAIGMINSADDGYCVYYDMKEKFIETMKDHGDMKNSFLEAIEAGLKSIKSDMEYQETFEYFKDMVDVNDYEFYDNGNLI